MCDRSKYSHNGVYKCENFAQHVEDGDFFQTARIHFPFHSLISFDILIEDDVTRVAPYIVNRRQSNIQISFCFNILKKDGTSSFETESKHIYLESREECWGKKMDIVELLDENNGYLDNGALTLEYGVQLESEQWEDGIWMFNFHDKFFEWQTKDYMFTFTKRDGHVYCHKQILKLHSTTIDANKNSVWVPFFPYGACSMFVQISHGVRFQKNIFSAIDYRNVVRIAYYFGFSNTVKYCEQLLIITEPKLKINLFKMAVKRDMRCYLVFLLKQIETKKQLVKIMRGLNLEKMSSQTMKAIVAKIFSL
ncbi:unnamed protein product [Caenorhabditis brenneri]